MIVVRYEEVTRDAATGDCIHARLGEDTHDGIDEVLLPTDPAQNNPIFLTKKFAGHPEYRWQVDRVMTLADTIALTYVITLIRQPQIDKQFYLKNILITRSCPARRVLHPWCIVEVELGHSANVGKQCGRISGNKRYVDTIQLYSMPKRRLAVVTQVIERNVEDLIQIIPVSSKQPLGLDKSAVDLTSELTSMVHYRKRSWAICTMVQTITASRVIAPMIHSTPLNQARDRSFRTLIRGKVRAQLKDAILHGVAAEGRLNDTAALAAERILTAELRREVDELKGKVRLLALYEKFVTESGCTFDDLCVLFPEDVEEL